MSDIDWFAVNREIKKYLEANRRLLTEDEKDGVRHYVAMDEYEMALELLCLALMKKPDSRLSDLEELVVLAKTLRLDEETIYDSDFWTNIHEELNRRRKQQP